MLKKKYKAVYVLSLRRDRRTRNSTAQLFHTPTHQAQLKTLILKEEFPKSIKMKSTFAILLACATSIVSGMAVPATDDPVLEPTKVVKRATSTSTALITATPTHGEYFGAVTVDGVAYSSVLYDTGSNGL